ncbi:MAG: hypothetical protein HIU91_14590 [Acidobacteria bacterium]|nr:hypothetical protein [Acidobacteriota bacterium]
MPDEILCDDQRRYIEYLQEKMLDPLWIAVFEQSRWADWSAYLVKRAERLYPEIFESKDPNVLALFDPKKAPYDTKFELPTTIADFGSRLADVKRAADLLGIKTNGNILLATSTDISPSPSSLPTTGDHLIFAGLGTSLYCNYWSKAITAIVTAIQPVLGLDRVLVSADIRRVFEADPSGIILAARLALYYAHFGTIIGFGEVNEPINKTGYRVLLLRAMEIFAVAHEYAHCVVGEKLPHSSGQLDSSESIDLENLCDEIGLLLSREVGNFYEDYLLFVGIGPLIFFRTMQICEDVREQIACSESHELSFNKRRISSGSHPVTESRVEALKNQIYLKTAVEQRENATLFVEEYDRILIEVLREVKESVSSMLNDKNSSSSS